jgi:hypothetical protein
MNTPVQEKPLSPYLDGLVGQGSLPEYVAKILNRLPDWKVQREAFELWKDRLDGPADEKVEEFKRYGQFDMPLDFLLYPGEILVKEPFFYEEESVDEFIELLRSRLVTFMQKHICAICAKPMGVNPHLDCYRLQGFRGHYECLTNLHNSGKISLEDERKRLSYPAQIKEFEQAMASGRHADGKPWNAPKTER